MDYLFFVIGLALLLVGANYLVDSSVAIAQRAHISNFIIGLTVVGMGTSAPELFISVSSAITGHGDVAIGNVVGSNICNILLILGVTATIFPFTIGRDVSRRDIPLGIFAALLLFALCNDSFIPGISENTLSRLDAVLLLLIFIGYMCWVIVGKGRNPEQALAEADEQTQSSLAGRHPVLLWAIAAVSLAALVGGGQLFLDATQNIARAWGVSEAVISITIVALGTSLPELITAVIAACKRNPELALGNVIGSNVFNILMILGIAGLVSPITIQAVNVVDFMVMIGASLATFIIVKTFRRDFFDRIEGILFLLAYVAYNIYLFMR